MAKRARSYVVSLENRKARGAGHERPGEILAAARALFLERGIENVSTRQIAARVGISQTALYVYFPNKEQMLDSLVDQAFRKLVLALRSIEADQSDLVAYLRAAMLAYIRFGLDNPDEYRLAFMLRDARHAGPMSGADGNVSGMEAFALLEQLVSKGVAAKVIRAKRGQKRSSALALWAAIHGLVALVIAYPGLSGSELDALVEAQVTILLFGITSPERNDQPERQPRGTTKS